MRPLTQKEIERLSVRQPKPIEREREREKEWRQHRRERERWRQRRRWREMPPVSPIPANTVRRDITAMIKHVEISWGKNSFTNHCLMAAFESTGGSQETYRVLRKSVGGLPAVWNNAPERTRDDVLRLLRGILHGE